MNIDQQNPIATNDTNSLDMISDFIASPMV
jgi:hypothetical protein